MAAASTDPGAADGLSPRRALPPRTDGETLLRDLAELLAAATGPERVVIAVAQSVAGALNVDFVQVEVERPAATGDGKGTVPGQPLCGSFGDPPAGVTAELRELVMGIGDVAIGEILVQKSGAEAFGPAPRAQLAEAGRLVGTLLEFAAAEPDLSSQAEGAFIALAAALDTHDEFGVGRPARVAAICNILGRELPLEPERMIVLSGAAAVYDCGTLVTPDLVLQKPGPLNAGEILAIRHHVQQTLEILRRIDLPPELDDVRVIAAQHHERFDGSGYPLGLRGEAIMTEARILSVADVLDAMMSERPYRPAFPAAQALEHVLHGAGTLFDPDVVVAVERTWELILQCWEREQ